MWWWWKWIHDTDGRTDGDRNADLHAYGSAVDHCAGRHGVAEHRERREW